MEINCFIEYRFPYRCFKNGGGAFLIPYFIMMALIGLPLFYMETAWGQFGSLSSIAIFKMIPLFKGLGYGILLVVSFIALYYNVLNAQFLYYIFLSMREPVPWSKCYDYWNPTPCCLDCQSVNDTDCAPYNRNLSETQNCTKLNFAAEEFYKSVSKNIILSAEFKLINHFMIFSAVVTTFCRLAMA